MNLCTRTRFYFNYSFSIKAIEFPTTGFLIEKNLDLESLVKDKIEKKELSIEGIKIPRAGIDYYSQGGRIIKVKNYTYPSSSLCDSIRFLF